MTYNPKRRVTLEERKIIENLLKQGSSILQISLAINRNHNTILYEINSNGGREIYDAEKAHAAVGTHKLNTIIKYPIFTLDERERIQNLIQKGYSFRQISKIINRARTSIGLEINSNGGILKYDAVKAHEKCTNRKHSGNTQMFFEEACAVDESVQEKPADYEGLEERIACLEMQIQILTDQLRIIAHERSKTNN